MQTKKKKIRNCVLPLSYRSIAVVLSFLFLYTYDFLIWSFAWAITKSQCFKIMTEKRRRSGRRKCKKDKEKRRCGDCLHSSEKFISDADWPRWGTVFRTWLSVRNKLNIVFLTRAPGKTPSLIFLMTGWCKVERLTIQTMLHSFIFCLNAS